MPASRPVSSRMSTCVGGAPQSILVPAPRRRPPPGRARRPAAAPRRRRAAPPGTATQRPATARPPRRPARPAGRTVGPQIAANRRRDVERARTGAEDRTQAAAAIGGIVHVFERSWSDGYSGMPPLACRRTRRRRPAGNVAAVTTETPAPAAKRVPTERTYHGDTVTDEYAWLADKDDPETIAYLRRRTPGPRRGRRTWPGCATRCSRRSAAAPRRPTCRCRPARAGTGITPAPSRASSTASSAAGPSATARPTRRSAPTAPRWTARRCCSTATLLAEGHDFFSLGHVRRQPGRPLAGLLHRLLRRRALHPAGEGPAHRRGAAPTRCPDTFYGTAWSADASALFYITVDDGLAANRVWRHTVGSAGRRRRGRLRGGRRAVLGRRRADPLREVHPHRRRTARSPARCGSSRPATRPASRP